MTNEEVECPYCGQVFTGDEDQDARTKEGVHRAEEHVNDNSSDTKKSKGTNIVNKWKSDAKRA